MHTVQGVLRTQPGLTCEPRQRHAVVARESPHQVQEVVFRLHLSSLGKVLCWLNLTLVRTRRPGTPPDQGGVLMSVDVKEVTDETFAREVVSAPLPVVVDFTATRC